MAEPTAESNGKTTNPAPLATDKPDQSPVFNAKLLAEMVENVAMMRTDFMRHLIDPRRNINHECGYPEGEVSVETYQDLYNRDALAVRVVQVLPRECWQVQPQVYERVEDGVITPFEQTWRGLANQLRGEDSYYEDEVQNLIWEYLRRADELSGIGRYGILLIGIDDNKPLDVPATFGAKNTKLLYLRPFPETLVQPDTLEINDADPRFDQPTLYTVQFTNGAKKVHWTRVLHIADNLDSSELYGAPRMRPVLNRILDLNKLYGGSAEMYWRGAFPGVSIETHPQLNPNDVTIDHGKLRTMMEEYGNGLQRYFTLLGLTAKSMAPQVVDPTPQIRVQIEAICIRLGVPKRIFMGSERGELASIQDDKTWNDRLKERQRNYVTPRLIVPFVNRLINLGVLPKPKKYTVLWPDMSFQTENERAKVAIVKTEALLRYAESLPNPIIAPMDFLTIIMQMSFEEAKSLVASVKKMGWENAFKLDAKALNPQGTFIKSDGQVVSDADGAIRIPGGE